MVYEYVDIDNCIAMNKLSLYERPVHYTDKKRETLYIKKDEDKELINETSKSDERNREKVIQDI